MKNKFPESFYNYTTFVGVAISVISFGLIIFLIVLELFTTDHKPYMGIIAFVLLPSFLILGLILIAFGAYRKNKQILKGTAKEFKYPSIDLNNPKQLYAFMVFTTGTILLLMFSAFGSYKAYEYTESDKFCGTMCHKVMAPEFTAYQSSPHARVGCVKCHIGSGAGWYVRSKLSGAYQVYSVLFNKYSKPIPTPIENLRPAQETCEQCHWPKYFSNNKQQSFSYYLSDEKNTKFTLNMLMKIAGGSSETGITSGIHWHMNIANEVEYYSTDEKRQNIPWVKVKNQNGDERIYKSIEDNNNLNLDGLEKHKMDCIDCHNRPSHIYNTPSKSVNENILTNKIDKSLPFIKNISIEALETEYLNSKNAIDSIKILVEQYYSENYPEVYKSEKTKINKSIVSLQNIYSKNYFPEMKTNWKYFPNNVGHLYSNGCFRCHDGKHVSNDGKVLTKDCNVCHSILSQNFENGNKFSSIEGIKYRHPVDIGDEWDKINCTVCHQKSFK